MAEAGENKELVTGEKPEEGLPEGGVAVGEQAEETGGAPGKEKIDPPSKGSKKWIVLSIPLLILVISGITIKFYPGFLNKGQDKDLFTRSVDINNDNLNEEILSPFFIPPSDERSRGAVRIDFSVIWDGLASIRFSKRELRIRSDLSKFITDFADKTDDLNENIPLLEQEMTSFFRNALGVRDLAIKIKEIRYI